MTREEVIAMATRIAELRAEIARLGPFQKELKQLEARLDALTGAPVAEPDGTSIADKVEQFIDSNPQRDWEGQDVAKELGLQLGSTRAALSKLYSADKIVKSGRGKYRSRKSSGASAETQKEEDKVTPIKAA